jgi:hypothetical protein
MLTICHALFASRLIKSNEPNLEYKSRVGRDSQRRVALGAISMLGLDCELSPLVFRHRLDASTDAWHEILAAERHLGCNAFLEVTLGDLRAILKRHDVVELYGRFS